MDPMVKEEHFYVYQQLFQLKSQYVHLTNIQANKPNGTTFYSFKNGGKAFPGFS